MLMTKRKPASVFTMLLWLTGGTVAKTATRGERRR